MYKRYASLHFCFAIEQDDNELITLAVIHRFVELLDKYGAPSSLSFLTIYSPSLPLLLCRVHGYQV